MIEIGPQWVDPPGHFVFKGQPVEWHDSYRGVSAEDLPALLVGRTVVAVRLKEEIALLRLDDGTHVGIRGGGQGGEGWVEVMAWDDDPPEPSS